MNRYWLYGGMLAALLVAVPLDRCAADTIRYEYDAQNRLTRVSYPDGTVTDYVYDNMGNRLQETTVLAGAPVNQPPTAPSNPGCALSRIPSPGAV